MQPIFSAEAPAHVALGLRSVFRGGFCAAWGVPRPYTWEEVSGERFAELLERRIKEVEALLLDLATLGNPKGD